MGDDFVYVRLYDGTGVRLLMETVLSVSVFQAYCKRGYTWWETPYRCPSWTAIDVPMEIWAGTEGDGLGRCAPVPFWCPPIPVSLFCLGRLSKSITTVSTTCSGHPLGRACHFAT